MDMFTSSAAHAVLAIEAGLNAFSQVQQQLAKSNMVIDITPTNDSTPDAAGSTRANTFAATPAAHWQGRIVGTKQGASKAGMKEKELLLSGPHSPLWSGHRRTRRPPDAALLDAKEWGI